MRRVIVSTCIVVGLGALISAAPAPPPPMSVPQKLAQRVKFSGFDDPRITLGEALDKLGKLYDLNFDINEKGFKFENINDVAKTPITETGPIPAMKNARLSTVLRKVLSRIPVPSGATFNVRGDHIEITTGTIQATEVWGNYKGPHLPLVNATFDKSPLEDAVKELSEQSDFNVVLDNRAADKAKTPVTAQFRNTPLDTALRLLSDMADLRSVHLDNVLYVTTKENAAALEARLEKEQNNPLEDAEGISRPRKGTGPGNVTIAPANGGM